ncbi:four helix bundle protein [uncultured Cytophaga sp.]|uniref:four helix bundle protein n=1 Tax=uncultured Cytophaga sp. TaxID=160238 RepID=UPI00261EDB57|nr:four helix bundle protein [uncultured Cytophaga sp.]
MYKYKQLKLWQKSMNVTADIYKITEKLPDKERYNLISQICRSAVSIPSNIAEGAGRNSKKDFSHFLSIALGSSFELETQVILTEKLNYLSKTQIDDILAQLIEIQSMILGLKKSLE